MSQTWYQGYIQLAFRIGKKIQKFNDSHFVDAYYGPPEWKEEVEQEGESDSGKLVRDALKLADTLPDQDFEPRHTIYLGKQVLAMETLARKFAGETFSLEDEVQRCFDIRPEWIPESQFEEALKIYEEVLPGTGSLFERRQSYKKRHELAPEKIHLLPKILRRTMDEAGRRTRLLVDLPAGEEIEINMVKDKPYGGACWYLGNYRSLIDVNTDLPTNLSTLMDLITHEGYPGHHTEAVLKEQHLYRECGHLDQSILLLTTPHCLVSEGIAMLAGEMIFSPTEIEEWMAENIYPELGMEPDTVGSTRLYRASELLDGVWCNAAFMLNQKRPDEEVMQYMQKYMLFKPEDAPKYLEFLKVPFQEAYVFTYYYGKHLMETWLQGQDKHEVFRRFLKEQMMPSDFLK
ncbi:MAG TPA: hypothetical protein VFN23_05040 [Ktedonobacteraceae bacterium]|nr:hypothetical protein [Ktedonobacteraceae bacterium]